MGLVYLLVWKKQKKEKCTKDDILVQIKNEQLTKDRYLFNNKEQIENFKTLDECLTVLIENNVTMYDFIKECIKIKKEISILFNGMQIEHFSLGHGCLINTEINDENEISFYIRFNEVKCFPECKFNINYFPNIDIPKFILIEDNFIRLLLEKIKTNSEIVIKKKIKSYVEDRKINKLLHFTRIENIEHILDKGVLSVLQLKELEETYIINDSKRYDGRLDANCLSISFPNYKYFYKLRTDNPDVEWIILEICPSVLWDKKCLFYPGNAAKKEYSSKNQEYFSTVESFNKMFVCEKQGILRSDLRIPPYYTTDPQAEVLVLDKIEPRYIRAIHVYSNYTYSKLYAKYNSRVKLEVTKDLFNHRSDYSYWCKMN